LNILSLRVVVVVLAAVVVPVVLEQAQVFR